jgi:hypothetical protein
LSFGQIRQLCITGFKKSAKGIYYFSSDLPRIFLQKKGICCIDEDGNETIKDIIQKEIYLEN